MDNYKKRITVHGGAGGSGFVSFSTGKFSAIGAPDGGSGGSGGSVYIKYDAALFDLNAFNNLTDYRAGDGGGGGKKTASGKRGEDLLINVPAGTRVYAVSGKTRKLLGAADGGAEGGGETGSAGVGGAERGGSGEKMLVARGGRGGRGNRSYASSKNRSPLLAEAGEQGEKVLLELDTAIMSDAAFVGTINSAKLAVMAHVSGARSAPPANSAQFSGAPNLLTLKTPLKNYLFLDLPYIYASASAQSFIKHLASAKVIAFVLAGGGRAELAADYASLRAEIDAFDADLLTRTPHVTVTVDVAAGEVPPEVAGENHFAVSEGDSAAFDRLREKLIVLADAAAAELGAAATSGDSAAGGAPETADSGGDSSSAAADSAGAGEDLPRIELAKGQRSQPSVEVAADGKFHIRHPRAVRLANGSNLNDLRALVQFRGKLEEMGVIADLEKAGLGPNAIVCVGNWEFEWN